MQFARFEQDHCRLAVERYCARGFDGEPHSACGGFFVAQTQSRANGKGRIPGWVLVTGASAGIGREIAKAFASRGYDLVLAARREAAIETLGRNLAATHAIRVKTLPVDLSLPAAAEAIADALAGAGVEVGVLVNNAGILNEGRFVADSLEDHLRLLQINVVALTSLTSLFLPEMAKRGRGRFLNVASIAAFMPVPHLAIYAATKAYVLSLTESIAAELKGTGVAATALCPGLTDTAMVKGSELGKPIPKLMLMSPGEVAELGCAACLRGDAICVPGLANKVLTGWAPVAPRSLVRAVGAAMNGGGWGRLAAMFPGLGASPDRGAER
jgi:short-subunit dehydrogenase